MSETVDAIVAKGFDFVGCTDQDPYRCECNTWRPEICPLCDKEIVNGEELFMVTRDTPYLLEDDPLQEYDHYFWHRACDPGTIAADKALMPDE